MQSFWSWISGSNGKSKSRKILEAEACFGPPELEAIRHHYQRALQAQGTPGQGPAKLQRHCFLHLLCGWPLTGPHAPGPPPPTQAPPSTSSSALLGQALFSVVCGSALKTVPAPPNTPGVATGAPNHNQHQQQVSISLDDVVLCKAMAERMGTDDSISFAFSVLSALPTDHTSTTTTTVTPGQLHPDTLTAAALKRAVKATIHLLVALGHLPASHTTPAAPAPSPTSTPAPPTSKSPGISTDDLYVDALVQGALWSAAGPAADAPAPHLDIQGYARWSRTCPWIHSTLTSLLSGVGRGGADTAAGGRPVPAPRPAPPLLPTCPELILSGPPLLPPKKGAAPVPVPAAVPAPGDALPSWLMLQPLTAMLLSHSMPPEHRGPWRLLFNSDKDGKSFNTLMGRLGTVEGATLVLVREEGEGGHLVAGYATAPWRKTGSFFGDHSTWVAGLLPQYQVYSATGANTNFQWCGQGFSQLVNGIGFGGAQGSVSAFALLVDSTLDKGQSRPIATFGSPSLTRDQVFQVAAVECWLVQQPDPQDSDTSNHKGASVLDKAAADRMIMGLAGKEVNHSAGYRPDEPIE